MKTLAHWLYSKNKKHLKLTKINVTPQNSDRPNKLQVPALNCIQTRPSYHRKHHLDKARHVNKVIVRSSISQILGNDDVVALQRSRPNDAPNDRLHPATALPLRKLDSRRKTRRWCSRCAFKADAARVLAHEVCCSYAPVKWRVNAEGNEVKRTTGANYVSSCRIVTLSRLSEYIITSCCVFCQSVLE